MSSELALTQNNNHSINNFQPVIAAIGPDGNKTDMTEFTLQVLTSLTSSVINNPQPVIAAIGQDENKIDIGEFALKVLASCASIFTSSILTITVSVMKLTGFTIVTSLALGYLTKHLHACNKSLAKHAFTPFKKWAEMLGNENERIIETDKVISIENRRICFNIENYKKHAIDSFKVVVAPISLALSLTNAALWLAVKPLWIAVLPGILGDGIVMGSIALNKAIGHVTYGPLNDISDWMFEKHSKYMEYVSAFMEEFD